MPILSATREADSRRIIVGSQPQGKKQFSETPISTTTTKKTRYGGIFLSSQLHQRCSQAEKS
jgi:hypothetical protein